MGAEPYQYLVDYEEDLQAALDKLRKQVFESGEFNAAEMNPDTLEEALDVSAGDGTRSILDINEYLRPAATLCRCVPSPRTS